MELAPGSRADSDFAALAEEVVAKSPTFGRGVEITPAQGGEPRARTAPDDARVEDDTRTSSASTTR